MCCHPAHVGKRVAGSGGAGAAVRLLTALLVEMDGLEAAHGVIVLAATNRPCTDKLQHFLQNNM